MSPDRDMAPDDKPDVPEPDIDAMFAQIVAGWDVPDSSPVPRWPVSEDDDEAPARRPGRSPGHPDQRSQPGADSSRGRREDDPAPAGEPAAGDDAAGSPAGGGDGDAQDGAQARTPDLPGPPEAGPRDWEAAADHEEGFVPPEPPPLPRGDLTTWLAWAGALLGPLFLVCAGIFWEGVSRLWLGLAVIAFVAGFVVLVLRLPDRDDSGDDGAVV